mgnify:CR=1 FL=1
MTRQAGGSAVFDAEGGLLFTSAAGEESKRLVPCRSGCRECALIDSSSPASCEGCPVPWVLSHRQSRSKIMTLDDGSTCLVRCRPLFDDRGRLNGAVSTIENGMVPRNTYVQLLRSRERLQAVLQSSRLAWWEEDFTTGEVLRSDSWAEMLGYAPSKIAATKDVWLKLIHPDDLGVVRKAAAAHERGETDTFEVQHRMRTADGGWKWILNWGRIVDRDRQGRPLRALGTHMDITANKETELEREELIRELQAAVDEIRTLKGIIPICARCKKIRDDSGYWEQLEVYLRQRSGAEFSHGLCPDCARELYGELHAGEDHAGGGEDACRED